MKPTIIFDFDGTLADSRSIFLEIYNQIADKHQYSRIQPAEIERLQALSIPQRCNYLKVPLYKAPFLITEFLNIYREYTSEIPLYEGIAPMLTQLHAAGYQLAIISSNEEDIIRSFLTKHELSMIEKVYASRSLFGKHHIMKRFLKKYDLTTSDVLYVGDELRDVKACHKAGLSIVWVDWGYDLPSLVLPAKPQFIAHSPEMLHHIICEQLPIKRE